MIRHLFILLLLFIGGCERQTSETAEMLIDPVTLGSRVAQWQSKKMTRSVASTTALINQTNRFLTNPNEETRRNWRDAWVTAHEDFHQATLLQDPETLLDIDVWPIAPGFLDSLPDYPESGIINDLMLEITPVALKEQHMLTDRSEASLGFHVLEYYAFDRPMADFQPGINALRERRRELVSTISDHLLIQVLALQKARQTDETESLPQMTYPQLVEILATRTARISSDLNFGAQHGEYSHRYAQVIKGQLNAIQELLDGEVDINQYLEAQNHEQAGVLGSTLAEAVALIPDDGQPNESDSSRLQLLAAAISHRLEDFHEQYDPGWIE